MLQLQFWNMLLQKCWMDSQTWPEYGFLLPTPPKADLESFTFTCVSSVLAHTLPTSCVRHQQRWWISAVSQFTLQSLSLGGKMRWQLKLVSLSPRQGKKALPQALLCDCVEVVEERRPRGRHSTYCRHMYASWPGKTLAFPRRKLQDIGVATLSTTPD